MQKKEGSGGAGKESRGVEVASGKQVTQERTEKDQQLLSQMRHMEMIEREEKREESQLLQCVVVVKCDNQTALRVVETGLAPTMRHATRTHRVNVGWLHERLQAGQIALQFVETQKQRADILTKVICGRQKWQQLLALVGVRRISAQTALGARDGAFEPGITDCAVATPPTAKAMEKRWSRSGTTPGATTWGNWTGVSQQAGSGASVPVSSMPPPTPVAAASSADPMGSQAATQGMQQQPAQPEPEQPERMIGELPTRNACEWISYEDVTQRVNRVGDLLEFAPLPYLQKLARSLVCLENPVDLIHLQAYMQERGKLLHPVAILAQVVTSSLSVGHPVLGDRSLS